MAAKIIFIDPFEQEFLVATFRATIEANQAASMFQAMLHPESKAMYVVETKEKGVNKRRMVQSFRATVANSINIREHLGIR